MPSLFIKPIAIPSKIGRDFIVVVYFLGGVHSIRLTESGLITDV